MGLEQLADLLGHRDGASEPGLGGGEGAERVGAVDVQCFGAEVDVSPAQGDQLTHPQARGVPPV